MRAEQLTECGDKLKELIRSLDKEREAGSGVVAPIKLAEFQRSYSDIVTDVENHNRNDYRFAVLEMVNDYFITGFPRFKMYWEAQIIWVFGFVLPIFLMLMEVVFITDMIGASEILTPYLNGKAVAAKLINKPSKTLPTATERKRWP